MSWLFIQEPSMRPRSPSPVLGLWAAQEASRTQEANQDFSILISILECELYPKESPEVEGGGVILERSFLLTILRLWRVWEEGVGKSSAFPGRAHCLPCFNPHFLDQPRGATMTGSPLMGQPPAPVRPYLGTSLSLLTPQLCSPTLNKCLGWGQEGSCPLLALHSSTS